MNLKSKIISFPHAKHSSVISEATKQETDSQKRFWGATFVVAGTTIGAGMLALPMSVAALGLVGGSLLLIALWYIAYCAAKVAIELNIHVGVGSSVAKLADQYLGKIAGFIGAVVLVMLFNTLLMAYTSGASSLMKNLLSTHTNLAINQSTLMVIFTAIMACLICIDMKILDAGNRLFFAIMIGVFILIMVALSPNMKFPKEILFVQHAGAAPWLIAFPLFFTSFGFHGSIPSVMNYCNNQQETLKQAFLWGTLIPLGTYLLWITGGLSIIFSCDREIFNQLVMGQADLGHFVGALSKTLKTGWFQSFNWVFTLLAIITSFLGVAIGLFDFYRERLSNIKALQGRFPAGLLALGIPLIIALIADKTFEKVLSFAGIFLSILAIGIPCLIWLKLYNQKELKGNLSPGFVKALLVIGAGVIVCEICNIFF